MSGSGVVAGGLWVVMCGYEWLIVVMSGCAVVTGGFEWLWLVLSGFAGGYEWWRRFLLGSLRRQFVMVSLMIAGAKHKE